VGGFSRSQLAVRLLSLFRMNIVRTIRALGVYGVTGVCNDTQVDSFDTYNCKSVAVLLRSVLSGMRIKLGE
jgi:hypothetical protein